MVALLVAAIIAGGVLYLRNQNVPNPSGQAARSPFLADEQAATAAQAVAQAPTTCPSSLITVQTEGPYYKAGSPQTATLAAADTPGEPLLLTGYVYDQDCQPIANAWLDFWQADEKGAYDNTGYALRGHQFTDPQGKYVLQTVIPGQYAGRAHHIHVKLRATDSASVVTSQLYFPGAEGNAEDALFAPSMVITLQPTDTHAVGYFNFRI